MIYPGGKNAVFQKIINLIPPHRVYIEPFAGSAAVARFKRPARENILIEIDPEQVKALIAGSSDSPGAIAGNGEAAASPEAARGAPIARNDEAGPPAAIAKNGDSAIVRNGVGRPGNLARNGAASSSGIEHHHSWRGAPATIAGDGEATRWAPLTPQRGESKGEWAVVQGDALQFLRSYPFQGDEFVYADPPYVRSVRRDHRQLYRYELSDEDHVDLLDCLKALPCKVMISGYWSELYGSMLAGWHTYTFEAMTRGGSVATEWLWMNYPTPVELHDYRYLGDNFRERERIKRKKQRWVKRLEKMDILERRALLAALANKEILE